MPGKTCQHFSALTLRMPITTSELRNLKIYISLRSKKGLIKRVKILVKEDLEFQESWKLETGAGSLIHFLNINFSITWCQTNILNILVVILWSVVSSLSPIFWFCEPLPLDGTCLDLFGVSQKFPNKIGQKVSPNNKRSP